MPALKFDVCSEAWATNNYNWQVFQTGCHNWEGDYLVTNSSMLKYCWIQGFVITTAYIVMVKFEYAAQQNDYILNSLVNDTTDKENITQTTSLGSVVHCSRRRSGCRRYSHHQTSQQQRTTKGLSPPLGRCMSPWTRVTSALARVVRKFKVNVPAYHGTRWSSAQAVGPTNQLSYRTSSIRRDYSDSSRRHGHGQLHRHPQPKPSWGSRRH